MVILHSFTGKTINSCGHPTIRTTTDEYWWFPLTRIFATSRWRRYIFVPGLVNVHKKLWKDPPMLMGKTTISTGPCSSSLFVCLPEGISHSNHHFCWFFIPLNHHLSHVRFLYVYQAGSIPFKPPYFCWLNPIKKKNIIYPLKSSPTDRDVGPAP